MRYSIVIKFAVQWQETKNAEDITSFKTRSMPCRQSWSQIACMCLAVLAENGDVYQSAAWLNGKKTYVIRDFVHWYLKTTCRFSQSSLKSSCRADFPTSKKPGAKLPPLFFLATRKLTSSAALRLIIPIFGIKFISSRPRETSMNGMV